MWLNTAHRLLKQELSRRELQIMFVAIVLSVLSVYSLAGFAGQVQDALISRSSGFLAADRVLESAHPIDPTIYETAIEKVPDPIITAELLEFQTMAFAGDEFLLSSVKAINGPYPLRGKLLIQAGEEAAHSAKTGAPPAGEAWLDERAAKALNLNLGDVLEIGRSAFKVGAWIVSEPDAGFNVFRAGPRIMINGNDVAATGVVQPGSRLEYKMLFAGSESGLKSLGEEITSDLPANIEWYGVESGQSPLAQALTRARKFLLLASLLGVVLAATAIAVAARHYAERHFDPVAVFKTLGMPRRLIAWVYAYQLSLIACFATIFGLLLGYAVQEVALFLVGEKLAAGRVGFDGSAILLAVCTGLLCTLLFSLTPMLRLTRIPAMRVIRRDADYAGKMQWLSLFLTGFGLLALVALFSRDVVLTLALFSGVVVCAALMLAFSRGLIVLARMLGRNRGALSLSLAGLSRRANSNSIQILSFSVAIMLLITIVVLRHEMIAEWRQQLPDGTPNHFLINIAPHEVEPLGQVLQERNVPQSDLFPMVRGRLSAINGLSVHNRENGDSDGQGNRNDRELNLTWRQDVPEGNTLLLGDWWTDPDSPGVSVESGFAQRLGISLGDRLSFLVGGESLEVTVLNLREVDWQSMRPNFFMIFSPGSLADYPASYIGSFYLAPESKAWLPDLLSDFPTVTVLEIDRLITQIQSVIDQVSVALQYIMLLVVAASLLVLLAQTRASFEERRKEMVILRTLGASSSFIRSSIQWEFVVLGLLSGLLAGWMAEGSLYLIQTQVMEMNWRPHPEIWLLSTISGAVFVGLAGRFACRRLLQGSAMRQIRLLEG